MKKICIFLVIILIIVATIGYMYLNYKATYHEAQIKNAQYESYDGKEIFGTDLATLINKAIDDNTKNKREKDDIPIPNAITKTRTAAAIFNASAAFSIVYHPFFYKF